MAIEITPKAKIKMPPLAVNIGVLCLILVLAQVISYFYLEQLIEQKTVDIQEKEKALIPTPSETALEKEIRLISQKIDEFDRLLREHKKLLNVFDFLENICLPKVWFSKFNFVSEKNEVTISGQAESFIRLGQQIMVLKQEPLVKNLNVSGISIDKEGKINFSFLLTFDSRIFKQ